MYQRVLVWLFELWGLEWKDLCNRTALCDRVLHHQCGAGLLSGADVA
jgi:hypothetical protein